MQVQVSRVWARNVKARIMEQMIVAATPSRPLTRKGYLQPLGLFSVGV